jgi:hypothetical protein
MEEVNRARFESLVQRLETMDKRLEFHEEAIRTRFDVVAQRLETVQQSFAFDKRLSAIEAEKQKSA